jgi:hypothetical protein
MFTKIDTENPETEPKPNQYIAFKLGEIIFAGLYLGDKKASPFSANNEKSPVVLIEEWIPIRIWT